MKNKKKAFTLIELIITLALTSLILGVIYTFFITNTKSLSKIEINSELQNESQIIQNQLLEYGAQAKGIYSLNGNEVKSNNMLYKDILDSTGKIEVNEIVFEVAEDKYYFKVDESNKTLYLTKNNEASKVLSTNVIEFKIRPLDYRMKFDESSHENKGNLYEANGIEISFILNMKKGYSNVTIPASIIVKFRNR